MISQKPIVVGQVEKHEKSIALKGDLLQTMMQAVVQAGDIARYVTEKSAGDGKLC